MRLRALALLPILAAASTSVLHCGGQALTDPGADGGNPTLPDGGPPGADGGDPTEPPNEDAIGNTTASKIDLLLVVDDSASMGEKAKNLGASLGPLLRRLAPYGDIHLGVITSSLGSFGGDICPATANRHALLSTNGLDGAPVAAAASGFLRFAAGDDIEAFVTNATSLVGGVGESGCGFEAQLESAYHFLTAPDPWANIKLDANNQASLGTDVDQTLLAQRAAFLRPDSLVATILLTDEDDSSADPLAIGGQGWAFMNNQFPGSTMFRADGRSTTAPRASSACASDPASAECTSCGFAATCNPADPACQKLKNDANCTENGGYYEGTDDQLNVRFHRMKERYGVDPQYPIQRYVDALTKAKVPNRANEHPDTPRPDGKGRDVQPYAGKPTCTNPLFAASLPTSAGDELCALPKGPRGKELVLFAVIGGVPNTLVAGGAPNWSAVLGANPDAYDVTGIDPHMIASIAPRPGLPGPAARGDNGTDPVHGREWDTKKGDLQFACTFDLATPKTCTGNEPCDCFADASPPLCGTAANVQIKAKAYPTIRPLRVVQKLGERGIAGSICGSGAPSTTGASYAETLGILGDRMVARLTP